MKYSSNLADYCSLKQSNVIGQAYIEQEHVFIKFQTVSSIFSYVESYSNAAFWLSIVPSVRVMSLGRFTSNRSMSFS